MTLTTDLTSYDTKIRHAIDSAVPGIQSFKGPWITDRCSSTSIDDAFALKLAMASKLEDLKLTVTPTQ